MAVKKDTTIKAPPPVTPAPVVTTNTPPTLTVVVQDDKSQPTSGARVSITPSDASEVTNNVGEVQFKLGTAIKYDVTATYGSSTVTVPYYVTKDGATRLVVNPKYVKSVEQKLHPSFWSGDGFITTFSIILGVVVVFLVVWKLFKRRRK